MAKAGCAAIAVSAPEISSPAIKLCLFVMGKNPFKLMSQTFDRWNIHRHRNQPSFWGPIPPANEIP